MGFDTGFGVPGLSVYASGQTTAIELDDSCLLDNLSTGERLVVSIAGAGFATSTAVTDLLDGEQDVNNAYCRFVDTRRRYSTCGLGYFNMTVIDPTQDISLMPGGMLAAIENQQPYSMESFGALGGQ